MCYNYSQFIGVFYPPPNGCFKLVEQVYRECYGWDLGGMDEGITNDDERVTRLNEQIAKHFRRVRTPLEGDVILLDGIAWHVGVIVGKDLMLHQFANHAAIITNYTRSRWRNQIKGFYRYGG